MAAESKTRFHQEDTLGSALNRRAISFPSGAINSTSGIIPMGNFYEVNGTAGFMYSGNSSINSNNPVRNRAGNPSESALVDSVPVLKHDTGLAVEWSVQEQYKLEDGLVKYAGETNVMKYIKIAATLPDKTVRDVALRCRWMTRKRRKQDEHVGKKVNGRKVKLVESSLTTNMNSALPSHMAPNSAIKHHTTQNPSMANEVAGISCASKQLFAQNVLAFSQIAENLSSYKFQDNINLFFCVRDNINTILNHMSGMPGIMRHMPHLPVSINEDLVNSILPNKT